MAKDRNKSVPASYLILRRGNEILLMRRKGSGYYDGWYSVPAGHVEAGELPMNALIREIKEELSIVLDKDDIRLVHTMYRTKHDETGDRVDFFFAATRWAGENTESGIGYSELGLDRVVRNPSESTLAEIL